ncbi:MAG: DUF2530 domain-containing protein [Mycobacteriales bacterium]
MDDTAGDEAARPPAETAASAPVAVDVDGIAVVSVGTVLWAVALVLSLVYEDHLRRDGHLWWIATAACGFGLGLLGIAYCVRRRNRLGNPASRPPG